MKKSKKKLALNPKSDILVLTGWRAEDAQKLSTATQCFVISLPEGETLQKMTKTEAQKILEQIIKL